MRWLLLRGSDLGIRTTPGRTGHQDYAQIMLMLRRKPRTTDKIAEAINLRPASASRTMRALWSQRLIHVCRWELRGSAYAPVWRSGDIPDAPLPPGRTPRVRPIVRSEAVSFGAVWRLLTDGATTAEIGEESGLAPSTLHELLRHCRSIGLVRIREWLRPARNQGDSVPVYCLGMQPDAPKPAPMTRSELGAAAWQRQKQKQAAISAASVFTLAES